MTSDQFTTALDLLAQAKALPSTLGNAALRELRQSAEGRVFAIARGSNAWFVSELKRAIEEHLKGTLGRSKPQVIAFAQALLQRLGYTPATGFPGDAENDIPPAEPGSLQDLSSWKRLELIIDTERDVVRGKVKQLQGNTEIARALFPAWELVRLFQRDVPRGSIDSGSKGWGERWVQVGGPAPVYDRESHSTRLIAAKDDPVWQALGDSSRFDDALDTDHPPFAFRSGYGWQAVGKGECERLGVKIQGAETQDSKTQDTRQLAAMPLPPAPQAKTMDPTVRAQMLAARNRLAASLGVAQRAA